MSLTSLIKRPSSYSTKMKLPSPSKSYRPSKKFLRWPMRRIPRFAPRSPSHWTILAVPSSVKVRFKRLKSALNRPWRKPGHRTVRMRRISTQRQDQYQMIRMRATPRTISSKSTPCSKKTRHSFTLISARSFHSKASKYSLIFRHFTHFTIFMTNYEK